MKKKTFELVFITEKKNWPIWLKQSEDIQIFYRRPPVGDIVLNELIDTSNSIGSYRKSVRKKSSWKNHFAILF